jgi:23S rRNA pseudouridine1911/1915/1917 synthase
MPPEATVVAAEPGRLDAVLARLAAIPRAEVQRAIDEGRVTVDGEVCARSYRLRGGERLAIVPSPEMTVGPEDGVDVPIRYRDPHVVVLAKPAGLVVHPTTARRGGTLVNRLLQMGVPLAPAGGPLRPGIVHRLDAGTSGLMVVASTDEAFGVLRRMFRHHEVERRYLALVRGAPAHDTFTIDAPLGRRADRVVVGRVEGREASTVVRVRERAQAASLLEVAPETGRTHQIRVHLAAVGHPILGDRAYGGAGDAARALGLARPFLHSASIRFAHPIDGSEVAVDEPLPDDLADAWARARRDLRP